VEFSYKRGHWFLRFDSRCAGDYEDSRRRELSGPKCSATDWHDRCRLAYCCD
jgi:hypothetical protein